MEHYKGRHTKSTFSGIGSNLNCEWWKIQGSKKYGPCLQYFLYNNYWKIIHSTNRWRRWYLSSKRFISWKLLQHENNSHHWSWYKKYNAIPKAKQIIRLRWNNKWNLKILASPINHPLSYIYNHSLHIGSFPDQIKIAIVKPLYKKGDKTGMTN